MDDDYGDDTSINEHTLVLGMGVGTFIVLFFTIALTTVFIMSTPCNPNDKILSRIISFAVFGIIVLILFFAPRSNKFSYSIYEPHHYDSSVIPRIAVGSMMILFTVISIIFNIDESGLPKGVISIGEAETTNALWQH